VARITIELDTINGDTIQDIINAILVQAKPSATDEPKTYPYDERNVLNGTAGQPVKTDPAYASGETVSIKSDGPGAIAKAEFKPGSITSGLDGPVIAFGPFDGDRKRGEPGSGHRRRTNREIEEDKLYFESIKPHVEARAAAAVAEMEKGVHRDEAADARATQIEQARATGEIVDDDLLGISSGEERLGPDDAQDAADEAAESAANRTAEPTLDDLRRAIGLYQKKFGMEQAARRTKEMLGMPLFEVPSKDIGLMVHKVMAAVEHDEKDGAKFTPVQENAAVETPTATKDEVNAIFTAYAERYDGKGLEAEKWVNTQADIPRVFERLFGKGKASFKTVEKTPENLGQILVAVRAELEKNTFGRTPK
jgi:hypothetical protein